MDDATFNIVQASKLLECIDEAYINRDDWRPFVQAFADAVRAAERERCAVAGGAAADAGMDGYGVAAAIRGAA